MGLFDKLFGKKSQQDGAPAGQCPDCGAMAMTIGGRVQCTNPTCKNFLSVSSAVPTSGTPRRGSFSPAKPLNIRYRNFRGEEKTFVADASTMERKQQHFVAQVAPTGERIVLARNRMLNLAEVEAAFPQRVAAGQDWPSARERQVLNFHKKHGSSSPLYERIRAKYPNW